MNLIKRTLALCAAGVLTVATVAAQTKVYYVSLTEGEAITANPIKEHPQPEEIKKGGRVTVFPNIEFQTIAGVGGTFSEIGAEAFMTLNKKGQAEVMGALFGADAAAFSFCRTPIGASDYSKDAYSYAETEGDTELKSFSIDRDKKALIPTIKYAQTTNPQLKLFAAPWSPPAWMKANNTIVDGNKNHKRNNLKGDAINTYALYLAKYAEAYKAEGVNISRILIQNEGDASFPYPSCAMAPAQMAKVAAAMNTTFKAQNIEAEIWAGPFKTTPGLAMLEFAANKKALAAVSGIAMQSTMIQYISDLKDLAPGKPTMNSNSAPFAKGDGSNNIRQASGRFVEVATAINSGLQNFCYTNMIATETQIGGWEKVKQNSLVTISDGKATYNPDFAVMSLFGRFLKPGSVRIASNGRAAHNVITVKNGNEFYLFIKNDKKAVAIVDIADSANGSIKAEVPANSIAVVVYQAKEKKK